MATISLLAQLSLFVTLWTVAVGAGALGATPTDAQSLARGRALYQQYCAVCHGEHGRGNAKGVDVMARKPADLTLLARTHHGFPASYVEAIVKGTEQPPAHGSDAMLAWGAILQAGANGDTAEADARIHDIVRFVESLQRR